MTKKSNFSIFTWGILFSVGLGMGFFIGNLAKERTAIVQIVPSEYTVQESAPPGFDDFKVYDSDKLLSDKDFTRRVALIQNRMKVLMKKASPHLIRKPMNRQ